MHQSNFAAIGIALTGWMLDRNLGATAPNRQFQREKTTYGPNYSSTIA
jgi:hypothetical protein